MSSSDVAEVYDVLECRNHATPLGEAQRIQISRRDMAPMYWAEVYKVFRYYFPEQVALQLFPQEKHKLDNVNKYHLYVFPAGTLAAFDMLEER